MKLPELKIGDLIARVPIIQGGMGVGVSLAKLAAAVANEGGIGIISGAQNGFKEPDFKKDNHHANTVGLIKEIREARSLSPNGIIGVNFLAAAQNYSDLVMTAVKEKVDIIISGAGLPKNLPELVQGSSTKIIPIVSSGKAAATISKIWDRSYNRIPDAIIVEGPLAGGHLGFDFDELINENFKSLKELVQEVMNAIIPYEEKYQTRIPVIAAGGVYDGKDIAEYLEMGAAGVQIASRFVATEECDADPAFKEAYINAKEEDIKIIKSPVGMPGRALNNAFAQRVALERQKVKRCYNCIRGCDPATTPYCITDALVASVTGDVENGLIFVGHNVFKIDHLTTVKELMTEMITEAETYFNGVLSPTPA
jgi:NAD(P)H-dependent flavin oxidoreductase YrpB (nitropropane dioxygenase family)